MTEPYRPQAYWEERLSGNLGLTTVGHSGLGRAHNQWLYRARFRAMRQALHAARLAFRHPATAKAQSFETAAPLDFAHAWQLVTQGVPQP